jgi:hypothetical protein
VPLRSPRQGLLDARQLRRGEPRFPAPSPRGLQAVSATPVPSAQVTETPLSDDVRSFLHLQTTLAGANLSNSDFHAGS